MKKLKLFFLAITITASYSLTAQVTVSDDGSNPATSTMLEVKSENMGFLPPRVADTNAINTPPEGLMVYDLSSHCMRYYNGTRWSECIGVVKVWECGDVLVDSRDAQSYSTVQIGSQCWMAENLNVGTMISTPGRALDNGTIEKYCYNDNTEKCDTYGGMYPWEETMNYTSIPGTRGICPVGWHLPTDEEWCILENEVDAGTISCSSTGWRGTDAGGNLKEADTYHWTSSNTAVTNSSGFTALPGGYVDPPLSNFHELTHNAYFWSSSEDNGQAWKRGFIHNDVKVLRSNMHIEGHSFSVRCLKD